MTELQIRYFFEVAKQESFSRAAKTLFVSQPSVSCQISSLEEELGFALFDRSHKSKMSLTPAGKIFYEGMQHSHRIIDETLHRADIVSKYDIISARIGLVEGWRPLELMNRTIRRAQQDFPNSEISFECGNFRELHQRLLIDELDAILTVQTTLPVSDRLRISHITDAEATMFFSKNHVLQDPDHPTLMDFTNDTYYVLPSDETPLSRDITCGYLMSQKLDPVIIEKPNRDSLLLQIMFADGFTIFDNWTSVDPELRSLKLDSKIPLCLAELAVGVENPLIKIFHDEALKYANRKRTRL